MASLPDISLRNATFRRSFIAATVVFVILPLIFRTFSKRADTRSQISGTFQIPTSAPLPDYRSTFSISGRPDDFNHTAAFQVPADDRPAARHCDDVPTWHFTDLARAAAPINTSVPFAFHFNGANLVTEDNKDFTVPEGFCTIIFVPQVAWANVSEFRNLPIEGMGPDGIHGIIESPDIRLILTDHPRYWGTVSVEPESVLNGAFLDERVTLAVYTASYELHHPGYYQLTGEVEWQNYDWVMEDPIDLSEDWLPYNMSNVTIETKSPPIYLAGEPRSRPLAQCYHDGNLDMRGRWYNFKAFNPNMGNQTALNPRAGLDFANNNLTFDEWGWTFQPDDCQLQTFDPDDMLLCLQSRTMQFLGDSNSRRLAKSLMAGAQKWCHGINSTKDRFCQCEDHFQWNGTDGLGNFIDFKYLREVEERHTPTRFGYNATLFFDFVGGVLNAKLFNPWQFFYDGAPDPNHDQASIIAQRTREWGPVDLVHVSLIGWDQAAIRTPAEVLAALPEFRDTLYAAYPPTTRFVHRLANPNCCGETNHKVRYSGPRFQLFNTMWLQFWAADIRAGRVLIEDPSVLAGRSDAEFKMGEFCPTTHFRTPHVRLEAQMWLNAVCEKHDDGSVRMRDW